VSKRNAIALAAVALLALAGSAMATDVVYYAAEIWAGQTTDVGAVTATMHYTADDIATLEIHYATDAGWLMTECHLSITTASPVSRGAPGQYPYNSGTISTNSYSFNISIAELTSRFGIKWGSDVYVMPHCALTWVGSGNPPGGDSKPTGFGGCIVKPKKGSWFGSFGFVLTKPTMQARKLYNCGKIYPPDYWINYWGPTQVDSLPYHSAQDVLDYLGNGTVVNEGVTLAGVNYKTAADLFAAYDPTGKDFYWYYFTGFFVSVYCNTVANGELEDAYFDRPDTSDEFMENRQIKEIMGIANGYRQNQTPFADYYSMTNGVFWYILHNSAQKLGILWGGPQGRSVPLSQAARLTVSPNPFTGSTRIRLQNSLQSEARVSVYDLSGKKVNELTCNQVWNGTDARGQKLAAGVYLLRLVSGTQSVSARAVISR
jgi:hypothetical protein